MNLTINTFNPTFKALFVSPSGQEAIDYMQKLHGFGLKAYIRKMQEKRAEDKYVDGNLIGKPDEYGHYIPVLYIKDKVTGETLREHFDVDSPSYFSQHTIKTEDGQEVPENVVVLKDSKGNTRYFSNAEGFLWRAKGEQPYGHYQLGVIEALEYYYKDNFATNDKRQRDKFVDLILSAKKAYSEPLHKIVPEILTEENLLGRGREKDVYKIDKLPDYVLCVIRDKYNPDKPISPFHQCFQTNSVTDTDLPIMMNNNGMYIKKNIGGKSHSLPNWLEKFTGAKPLNYEDVQYFMNSLKELSMFPCKSYVNFAKSLQKLNEERVRIDTVNPNNILVDKDLQAINIIDLSSKDNKVPLGTVRPINGLSDMEAILCDSIMYTTLYDMATDEDKQKLDEYAKTIIKKCAIAAKVSNIGNFPPNTELYATHVEEQKESRKGDLVPNLKAFKEHFKDVLSKEIVSYSI